ncbi:ABC transporter ATP-binding protein [[Ruminococcus] gnavus]|jgi:ABC-type multidrug transport system fused ATPase/permease subunit|uniref:ABC transporter ATP-binding protein/permease n=1 Tax=Mediterraneibacter gnavus TaxID=33038 RepID=A0AAJ1B1D6_MEDGN|nr:ABC transporter ATP-binding protein [Mediterraneibacter gnavus]MBN2919178.1 ABC transporter ATP-binding protein [Lactobacillus sp.]MCB5495017.1 ABC transporter ATP-binding protein/permease [Mediterraneibacter gnavus]MCB5594284.1 ABC transporter ATP-binding protein/permease [Mediterraneibacter gnavus]MCB5607000.1 ABC transporter ATP-binding protein/permease [Mediterraneibacter gnavus]MCG4524350.1 ABC transporter ATP-binding protein/permease [Mediterraneibacter gnavus]
MDKVYKYFLKKYILEQKIYFAFVLVTVIAQSIITMCIPLTYQYMLDVVFPKGEVKKFWIVISIMFGCYMTVVVFNVLKDFFLARIAENISMDIRMDLNRKLSTMKYSYYDDHSLNEIVSKYSREVETIKENCGYMLVKTLSNGITFFMATIMIIKIEWRIMVVTAILLMLYLLNNRFWGARVKRLAERSMEKNEEAIGALSENYKNVLITKLYAAYDVVSEKFERIYMKQYKAQMALELTYSININSGGLLNYLLSLAIWVIGGIGVFAGNLTIGTVTALINYQSMLVSPLTFFAEFNNSYQGTMIAMKRLLQVLLYEEETEEGEQLEETIKKIEFSNTAFKYLKSDEIIKDVNIKLEKGNIYGFIGGSGCGKSTVVKLLLGLYMPADGTIYINDKAVQGISLASLRSRIGFVAQDSLFYQGTIMENLRMGKEVEKSKVIELSKLLDVYSDVMKLPEKWETQLNSGTSNLSGGQKKRLDVLRALLRESDVLIFDESTASIDLERRKRLFDILQKEKHDKIIVCITHNIEECSQFDYIFGVKDKSVYRVERDNLASAY